MNNNILYLCWQNPINEKKYLVGEISKGKKFTFKYTGDFESAKQDGWETLPAFPDTNRIYESDGLFLTFQSRLPDPKRKDIQAILKKYHMSEYDEFELLKRSSGILPIDNYSFSSR